MLYNLGNEADRQDFKEYCNQLYVLGREKGVWVELSKKRHTRSLQQNAYLHCILSLFASEFGMTLESVKYDVFKKTVNPEIFERKRRNRRGQEVTFIRSSADLDTKEMSLATERFRNWSASEMEFYIPGPSEHEALLMAQKQIERYKEYL